MSISIYNTLSRKKEEFQPLKRNTVGMYVCGPTVYDDPHIGHARAAYAFEIVRNYFQYKGFKTKFVKNITDVDDKIIQKAVFLSEKDKKLSNMGLKAATSFIAEKYLREYKEAMRLLGIKAATKEPKATAHIKDILIAIDILIRKKYAYVSGKSVYFDVSKLKDYGKLSEQNTEKMLEAIRIEKDENKKNPLDFALWKSSKLGEPSWDSKWGSGRPGWHIECTCMSMKYLGSPFDIHGGGLDLIFPHHENEIAQAEGLTGKQFAKFWMHNGLITIDGKKMAKSLGNFISVKDSIAQFGAETIKMFFLTAHYRHNLDYTEKNILASREALSRFLILFDKIEKLNQRNKFVFFRKIPQNIQNSFNEYKKLFHDSMDDDFNSPKALSVMFDIVNLCNKVLDDNSINEKTKTKFLLIAKYFLIKIGKNIFVIFKERENIDSKTVKMIQKEIERRDIARKAKNYSLADSIRTDLCKKGIVLEDTNDGTSWRKI